MVEKLTKYNTMRDFGATPEPSGKPATKKLAKGPIFVVQKHHASHLHYDFRLEIEGVLKSWAVPKGPSYDPATKRLAMMTEDHPYDYASFEGVIPEGNYGAGNVIVWDNGTWEFLEPGDDPAAAVKKGKLTFRLHGKKLKGEWALIQLRGRSERGNEWLLIKHQDELADPALDITTTKPLSVLSKRSVDEVSPRKQWESNRTASGKQKPRTMATALEEKKKEEKKKKVTIAKGTAARKSKPSSKGKKSPKPG